MRMVVVVRHIGPDRRAGVRARLDEADEVAVDQARRIALRRRDVQITAVVPGPAAAAASVRTALAFGADVGIHLHDPRFPGRDALATSRVLAAALGRVGFDLVLFGAGPADAGWAMMPGMVAERLGVPALCFADSLTVAEHHVEIGRDEVLDAALPAVVSVTERCGEPRYQRFGATLTAGRELVRTWTVPDDDDEVATTTVHAVVPLPRKQCTVVATDARSAAVRIADFLAERQML
jgi:electron transfer flavoprotein beta subunit